MSRTWLVTGSSRGFGRALAEVILTSGDRLVATARDPAQLADLVDRYGDQVRTAPLDVTDPGGRGSCGPGGHHRIWWSRCAGEQRGIR